MAALPRVALPAIVRERGRVGNEPLQARPVRAAEPGCAALNERRAACKANGVLVSRRPTATLPYRVPAG